MDIYLDDNRAALAATAEMTLGELVAATKQDLSARGRMLVGIVCDGLDVTGEGFAQQLQQPLSAFSRVDLQSADPTELAAEGLRTAGALLDATEEAIPEIVQEIAEGKLAEAMPKLGECCQAWLQVHEGICNVTTLRGIDPHKFVVDGGAMMAQLNVPADRLKQLRDALEAKDFVLVSDVLTYEFGEAIASWRALLAALETQPSPA